MGYSLDVDSNPLKNGSLARFCNVRVVFRVPKAHKTERAFELMSQITIAFLLEY